MEFIDLPAQQAHIKDKIDASIQSVLAHGKYIMGPEVHELEKQLTEFSGSKHCITCANGTDALSLALMALDIKEGDAVFVPSFTFAATIEVVPLTGAQSVLVDIDPDTYNMDPDSLKRAITFSLEKGLRPALVIAVDLFGLPANYPAIKKIADYYNLRIISDSAQGFGGSINGKMAGSFSDIMTTSFFPAKPLGCYGDGGALFTDNDELAALLDSLRVHGKGTEKYDNVRIGVNSRLDTIQAAILLEKLAIYPDEIIARNKLAQKYEQALRPHFKTPTVPKEYKSVWAQYTLQAATSAQRSQVMAHAKQHDIPSVIYYPRPIHQQTAYKDTLRDPKGLEHSEQAANCVFSIPMHGYVSENNSDKIISVLRR